MQSNRRLCEQMCDVFERACGDMDHTKSIGGLCNALTCGDRAGGDPHHTS